jgi:hypothetical protein
MMFLHSCLIFAACGLICYQHYLIGRLEGRTNDLANHLAQAANLIGVLANTLPVGGNDHETAV